MFDDTTIPLIDRSKTGKKRPWRKQKLTSSAVAASLIRNGKKKKSQQLRNRGRNMSVCGDYLVFGEWANRETGEITDVLNAAHFCRDRLCPMCQWRKSLVTFAQVSQLMDEIEKREPGAYVPIFLTFTVKNCTADELADTLSRLTRAWSRMVLKKYGRRAYRALVGWFRAIEVTYNPETDTWHPHVHAIGLVEADYFQRPEKYIDHERWIAEWRWALGVDYDPSVDVRTISNSQADAVAEASKYAVKPGDWLSDDHDETDERVALLADVLRNRRLVAFGGLMKTVRAELKQEDAESADLVNTGVEDDVRGDVLVAIDRYEWQCGVTNNYVLVEREKTNRIREDAPAEDGAGACPS